MPALVKVGKEAAWAFFELRHFRMNATVYAYKMQLETSVPGSFETQVCGKLGRLTHTAPLQMRIHVQRLHFLGLHLKGATVQDTPWGSDKSAAKYSSRLWISCQLHRFGWRQKLRSLRSKNSLRTSVQLLSLSQILLERNFSSLRDVRTWKETLYTRFRSVSVTTQF